MEKSEEEITVLVGMGSPEEVGREAPAVRATKSSESRKEE